MRLLLAISCFFALAGRAQAEGGMVGNGGDAVLQEFNLRGIQVANFLQAEPAIAQAHGIDPVQFLAVVKQTRLESHPQLFLRGQEVDAINYPWEHRIEVSRSRWAQSASRIDAYFVQRRIALHEYLWVYGINDELYVVSNPIMAAIERTVGPVMDPGIRRLLLNRFCERLSQLDFTGAGELLSWGLDLNQNCQTSGTEQSPVRHLLFTYLHTPSPGPVDLARLELIRRMLLLGLNPNQLGFGLGNPILVDAMNYDLGFMRLLFAFGADPNLMNEHGDSVFSVAAGLSGPKRMQGDTFRMFFDAGGDVNLQGEAYSPAQRIVSQQDNTDLVETLIQTGKVNWCRSLDPFLRIRTIDMVRAEYQPLLRKYQLQCGRFLSLVGRGDTCALAQEDGRKQCMDRQFKYIRFDPIKGSDGCLKSGHSGETPFYMARFLCSDEKLDN